ncbi:MAG: hypothetical protein A3F67_03635 [Verrucomicrobia bacterium RIFCSPHIGHO2_12_FULL_41_10]|nr:MAG: hypothetical protein A3F67_03635 [Verrucomicrobia bacterium RIFCSPHIGHO2_12_FULL_41_10]HLB34378.1 SUMF1/EgtB/PvdO family nonheme iron enzyme [Chthoniobacterales bacterium]
MIYNNSLAKVLFLSLLTIAPLMAEGNKIENSIPLVPTLKKESSVSTRKDDKRPLLAMPFVTVDYPHNKADSITGYGAVSYVFSMSAHEVTARDYCTFLNAVARTNDPYALYHQEMTSDPTIASINRFGREGKYSYVPIEQREYMPVTFVTIYDAARFCNWLHNGQPSGEENDQTTEMGAYTLKGTTSEPLIRNEDAHYFIPNENEWYKAAYYNGIAESYYTFPNRSSWAPHNTHEVTTPYNNEANYGTPITSEGDFRLTKVGVFTTSMSPCGAFDMGGNVAEWTETFEKTNFSKYDIRGGSWKSRYNKWSGMNDLESSAQNSAEPQQACSTIGFRVANSGVSGAAVVFSDTPDVWWPTPTQVETAAVVIGAAAIALKVPCSWRRNGVNTEVAASAEEIKGLVKEQTAQEARIDDLVNYSDSFQSPALPETIAFSSASTDRKGNGESIPHASSKLEEQGDFLLQKRIDQLCTEISLGESAYFSATEAAAADSKNAVAAIKAAEQLLNKSLAEIEFLCQRSEEYQGGNSDLILALEAHEITVHASMEAVLRSLRIVSDFKKPSLNLPSAAKGLLAQSSDSCTDQLWSTVAKIIKDHGKLLNKYQKELKAVQQSLTRNLSFSIKLQITTKDADFFNTIYSEEGKEVHGNEMSMNEETFKNYLVDLKKNARECISGIQGQGSNQFNNFNDTAADELAELAGTTLYQAEKYWEIWNRRKLSTDEKIKDVAQLFSQEEIHTMAPCYKIIGRNQKVWERINKSFFSKTELEAIQKNMLKNSDFQNVTSRKKR